VAAKPIISQLVLMKQAADLHSATINQMAVHQVAQACFESHIPKVRQTYRARRDAMLTALQAHMPAGVSWTKPEGGMFVWLTLPAGTSGAALLARALDTVKVAFVPGQAFFPDGSGENTLRLSFSNSVEDTIREGIRRLGQVLRDGG
jgi:DNA-binding transcriptional MocR family regulator